jgi:hypothetical protein
MLSSLPVGNNEGGGAKGKTDDGKYSKYTLLPETR